MIEIDPEKLNQVEEFAGLFMKPSDIAIVLMIDPQLFAEVWKDKNSQLFLRYQKGKLLADAEVRRSILTMAKQGSSPAQNLASKMIDEMNADEIDL